MNVCLGPYRHQHSQTVVRRYRRPQKSCTCLIAGPQSVTVVVIDVSAVCTYVAECHRVRKEEKTFYSNPKEMGQNPRNRLPPVRPPELRRYNA